MLFNNKEIKFQMGRICCSGILLLFVVHLLNTIENSKEKFNKMRHCSSKSTAAILCNKQNFWLFGKKIHHIKNNIVGHEIHNKKNINHTKLYRN